jgi:hypothetical protein
MCERRRAPAPTTPLLSDLIATSRTSGRAFASERQLAYF